MSPTDCDLLILGSGSTAFATARLACTRAREDGDHDRGAHGGRADQAVLLRAIPRSGAPARARLRPSATTSGGPRPGGGRLDPGGWWRYRRPPQAPAGAGLPRCAGDRATARGQGARQRASHEHQGGSSSSVGGWRAVTRLAAALIA